MSKYPISLRQVLNDRSDIESKGKLLVKSLLNAFCELEEAGVTLRNIQPTSIWLTQDLSKAMFSDVRKISDADKEPDMRSLNYPPYSC